MLICIQTIQNDSERSLVEDIYRSHIGTMIYIAQGILKDRYRAEDAVSQAFLKIIDNLQKITWYDCNKTRGFVVIIVRNICLNMIKDEKHEKILPLELCGDVAENAQDEPLNFLINEETYNFILSCLSELCDSHKDILRLKLIYEYTDEEIADILDISQENARVRLHRAKKALIAQMQKRGGNYEKNGTE
ncbi:MAG TPA: sigma-70 family RNA polymerase sigma factor [Clostridia bacterium]|nr:sigma-70 family RNA polymerase sigma factor [Clostridia bacterium]HEX3038820.1 sigma-70 family RNA polymerase sigma factor [Caproiciproducens sp.]